MVIIMGFPSVLCPFNVRRDFSRRECSSFNPFSSTGLLLLLLFLLVTGLVLDEAKLRFTFQLLRNGLVLVEETDFSFYLELSVDRNKCIDMTDLRF